MNNKAEESDITTGDIKKLEKAMFTRAFVFLYLLVYTSAETQLGCSVTRSRFFGDRFVFNNYTGTCNKGINPCKRVNGVWRYSVKGCSCQCMRSNSTYREDLESCVENEESREGCNLLFNREQDTQPLKVFHRSSSLKLNTLPRETCFVTGTAYVVANNGTVAWKQFKAPVLPFFIHHQDRKKDKHDHFLQWKGKPATELFGKIVKVDIQCLRTRDRGSDTLKKLCIVFKVKGITNLPCPGEATEPVPSTTFMTRVPQATELPVSNQTTTNHVIAVTDAVDIIPVEPNTTSDPSIIDNGNKDSHNVGKDAALPVWLIAVVAGGAVIATLCITIIIWLCWRMKRRSHKKRKKSRLKLENPLYNPDDDVTFAPWCGGTETNEPGYARVGSPPGHKGYAYLKPDPRRSRSEYQQLLKPNKDQSGYLLPLREVTTVTDSPLEPAIYSEAQSPKLPQNKPKSKEYDYAKPEGIMVLTASRSSLDNLDSQKDADADFNEAGYVETRDSEPNGPPSPLYAVVEGPNSPKSPGVPPDGAPSENELNDLPTDYVEVLPDTENENRNSKT